MKAEPQDERPAQHFETDALPDPEPAVPSLAEPDPGVYRHEPGNVKPPVPAQKDPSA